VPFSHRNEMYVPMCLALTTTTSSVASRPTGTLGIP
jgi:hypothetical protein